MVDVIFSRDIWNRKNRYIPESQAKQETKDLNDWCEKHNVKFETLPKRQIKAICPNAGVAYLFKVMWL